MCNIHDHHHYGGRRRHQRNNEKILFRCRILLEIVNQSENGQHYRALPSIFSSKLEFFLFAVRFLGHFCRYLVTDKDYFWHENDDCDFRQYVLHVRLHLMSLVIPIRGWVNLSGWWVKFLGGSEEKRVPRF